jgi:hypothetical protein
MPSLQTLFTPWCGQKRTSPSLSAAKAARAKQVAHRCSSVAPGCCLPSPQLLLWCRNDKDSVEVPGVLRSRTRGQWARRCRRSRAAVQSRPGSLWKRANCPKQQLVAFWKAYSAPVCRPPRCRRQQHHVAARYDICVPLSVAGARIRLLSAVVLRVALQKNLALCFNRSWSETFMCSTNCCRRMTSNCAT